MKKFRLAAVILIAIISLIFLKCKKDDDSDNVQPWSEKSPEVLNVAALGAMEGLNFLTDTSYTSNNPVSPNPNDCPIVTFFIASNPAAHIKYITTCDWSENGCTGSDGIIRKGKIVVTYTGKMNVPGSVAINTFSGFSNGGNRIEGFQEIKCIQPDPINNFPVYEEFSHLNLQFPDQNFSLYKSRFTRSLINGSETSSKEDDVWQLTGTIEGTTSDDVEWTAICSKPLIKKNSCKWFDSGTTVITPLKGSQCTIDYGTGTCDNKATITRDGKTIEVQL